jgi:hypothetical protein
MGQRLRFVNIDRASDNRLEIGSVAGPKWPIPSTGMVMAEIGRRGGARQPERPSAFALAAAQA